MEEASNKSSGTCSEFPQELNSIAYTVIIFLMYTVSEPPRARMPPRN